MRIIKYDDDENRPVILSENCEKFINFRQKLTLKEDVYVFLRGTIWLFSFHELSWSAVYGNV